MKKFRAVMVIEVDVLANDAREAEELAREYYHEADLYWSADSITEVDEATVAKGWYPVNDIIAFEKGDAR